MSTRSIMEAGDNGLLAFVFIMLCIVFAYVAQNKKYFRKKVMCAFLIWVEHVNYRKYCRIHKKEIIAMMKRRK